MKRWNQKGITLIVLVIVIIIVFILVGITFGVLTGENGLLYKAKKAEEEYELARQKEQNILNSYSSILIASNDNAQVTISIKDLKELIKEEIQNRPTTPVGTIISYMGNKIPTGYLACNGKDYNISEYPKLAEHIKNEFGKYNYFGGNGTTTFATPNLNEKFLKGSDTAGISEEAGLPNIKGQIIDMLSQEANGAFHKYMGIYQAKVEASSTARFGDIYFDASSYNSIYGKSTTVTPKNISINYCIKQE